MLPQQYMYTNELRQYCERHRFLNAAIFPRKCCRSPDTMLPYFLGKFAAAAKFPSGRISCDTGCYFCCHSSSSFPFRAITPGSDLLQCSVLTVARHETGPPSSYAERFAARVYMYVHRDRPGLQYAVFY